MTFTFYPNIKLMTKKRFKIYFEALARPENGSMKYKCIAKVVN